VPPAAYRADTLARLQDAFLTVHALDLDDDPREREEVKEHRTQSQRVALPPPRRESSGYSKADRTPSYQAEGFRSLDRFPYPVGGSGQFNRNRNDHVCKSSVSEVTVTRDCHQHRKCLQVSVSGGLGNRYGPDQSMRVRIPPPLLSRAKNRSDWRLFVNFSQAAIDILLNNETGDDLYDDAKDHQNDSRGG
jgi:hypothetical protein